MTEQNEINELKSKLQEKTEENKLLSEIKDNLINSSIEKNKKVKQKISVFSMPQSAEDIAKEDLPPIEWIIDGCLPVGLTFLVASPKVGKSFLLQKMAECIATGADFLGFPVKQGEVLYYDYDGSERQTQARMPNLKNFANKIYFMHPEKVAMPTLADGTMFKNIKYILNNYHEIRTVIIDTYGRAIGKKQKTNSNVFIEDYDFISKIHNFALEQNIAIICSHHTRKGSGKDTDPYDSINGTTGVGASTDCTMFLRKEKRMSEYATLDIIPRNGKEYALNLIQKHGGGAMEWALQSEEKALPALINYIIEHKPKINGESSYTFDYLRQEVFTRREMSPEEKTTFTATIKQTLKAYQGILYDRYNVVIRYTVLESGVSRGIRIITLEK